MGRSTPTGKVTEFKDEENNPFPGRGGEVKIPEEGGSCGISDELTRGGGEDVAGGGEEAGTIAKSSYGNRQLGKTPEKKGTVKGRSTAITEREGERKRGGANTGQGSPPLTGKKSRCEKKETKYLGGLPGGKRGRGGQPPASLRRVEAFFLKQRVGQPSDETKKREGCATEKTEKRGKLRKGDLT